MATLTADRHFAQRSLLDPHEEDVTSTPRPPQPRVARPAAPERPVPESPTAERPAAADPQPRVPASAGPTLDDLVAGTWDALAVTHAAACLVCGEDLIPRFSAGPRPVAAVCRSCGSELS